MKIILTAILLLGATALADSDGASFKTSFMYSDNRSAYSCDYVENQAKKILKILGVTNIEIHCYGGVPYQRSVMADIRFTVQTFRQGTMSLAGREACDFNVHLINSILKVLPVMNVKKSDSCWHAEGRYHYSFNY